MWEDFGEVLIVEGWLAEQEWRNPKTPLCYHGRYTVDMEMVYEGSGFW
jgi:hypothetical protein